MLQRVLAFVAAAAVSIAGAAASHAAVEGAVWTEADTTDNTASGTLNGVGFTATGFSDVSVIAPYNLSGPDYSAAPLSSTQQTLSYSPSDPITVTFNTAINDLMLYGLFWRPGTYNFDVNFSVESGFGSSTAASDEDTLVLNPVRNDGGILRFLSPVTSLTMSSTQRCCSLQVMTFGVDTTVIPLPAGLPLLLAGMGALGLAARRRSRARA